MVHALVLLAALLFNVSVEAQSCRGTLQKENNLSDVCNAATALSNLGAGPGTVTSVTAGEGLTTSPGSFGGSLTSTGTLTPVVQTNAQTGTTYTVLNSDCGKLVTFSNGSAVAVTLPQAGAASAFLNGCHIWFANLGVGNVTITPTTSTLDGLASRVLQRYQGMHAVSNGTNYNTGGVAPAVGADGIVDPDSLPTATAAIKGGVIAGTGLVMGGTGNKTISVTEAVRTRTYGLIIDGGTAVPSTGIQGAIYIPTACTITGYQLMATKFTSGSTGNMVIDLWLDDSGAYPPTIADTITASAKPTLSSAASSFSTTLTGWGTAVAAGDVIFVNLDSVATVTQASFQFTCLQG